MKKKSLLIFLLGFITQACFSQPTDKTKLDAYFQAMETNSRFMGSVALTQNGKIVYSKSIGYADVEGKVKPDENTKYRIGSITKTFTAVLVMKAMEENKLNLDQTIDTYFPTVKNANKITVRHLLSHRSGIHNFTNDQEYLNWNTKPRTETEMVDIIAKSNSDFEPDSKAEYSNSNFVLLAILISKVYKKPYAVVLNEKIIKPLGLKCTNYGGKIMQKENESYSYKYANSWIKEPETDMSVPLGAGAIVSTPTELAIFITALFEKKLISDASLTLMTTIMDNYGMGIFSIPFYEKQGFGHNGGIDGFTSVVAYFPDDKVSFSLTSNGTNTNNNNIVIAALSWFYGKDFEIPDFKVFEVKTEDLDPYLGVYASNQIPLKITITKLNATLIAQATGQPSFSLETVVKDKFKFDQAGVVLEFNPTLKQMILKQGGGIFTFTKE